MAHPKIPPTSFFDIPQGLREGSKLSPLLFNLAVNDMEAQLTGQHPPTGILVKRFGANAPNQLPIQTSIWQYADDVAMIAHSDWALKTLLERMATYCYQRGLTINYDKSHYMEVSTSPYTDGLSLSFKDPVDPLSELTINQVESYKYLGVPIHRDLQSKHVAKTACKKAWAAHHAAQRAGMRHYGLPLASRFTAWKAFVLPHILFFLPFVSVSDIPELQSMINSSLRDISDARASPEALCAEIGLLPVKWLWAQTLAINGGRLQSNRTPLRAAEIVTNLLSNPTSNDHKGLGKDYKIALFRLGLKTHWPLIQARELPAPQSPADKAMLGKPEENQESMSHFLWECNHLGPEQTVLDETLAQFVLNNGGIPSANAGPIRQWKELSDTDKLGLIMGNHIPTINHISNEYTVIQNWRTAFLEAADSPLTKLWKKRAQLIVETFPEWLISSADPTSIICWLHED